MENSAALIIAQDCAATALTLRGYALLVAVESPYVTGDRVPVAVDALFAHHILQGGIADALQAHYLEGLAAEADELDAEQAAALHAAVQEALGPVNLSLRGMESGDEKGKKSKKSKAKDIKPSNGLIPAILLRCAKEFGWSVRDALDTPIGTLMLILREDRVQQGKSISFGQMAMIDQMQADAAKAKGKETTHGG